MPAKLDQPPHGRLNVYLSLRNIDARLLVLAAVKDASSWFAFNEDQMGVSGFGPATTNQSGRI